MELSQYQIILVNLDPSEIKKTRPCIIISPDEMNRHLRNIIIARMTTTLKAYPTRIKVNLEGVNGFFVIDQIITIDKIRVIKSLGKLKEKEILEVKRVMQECFVL